MDNDNTRAKSLGQREPMVLRQFRQVRTVNRDQDSLVHQEDFRCSEAMRNGRRIVWFRTQSSSSTETTRNVFKSPSGSLIETYSPGTNRCELSR